MDINWSRYIEIARAQDLGSAEVARLIRTETRRKVNISEVKRRLSVSESAAAQIRQPNSLDVINLCEGEADEESTLSILMSSFVKHIPEHPLKLSLISLYSLLLLNEHSKTHPIQS